MQQQSKERSTFNLELQNSRKEAVLLGTVTLRSTTEFSHTTTV